MLNEILFFISGAIIAGVILWLFFKQKTINLIEKNSRIDRELVSLNQEISDKSKELNEATKQIARFEVELENEKRRTEEQIAILNKAREEFSDTFKALSSEALQSNNESFLKLAQTSLEKYQSEAKGDLDQRQQAIDNLVKPVKESLEHFQNQMNRAEKNREGAYQGLSQQVKLLLASEEKLKEETHNLVSALREPKVRGNWGEMQLRNAVEAAGMIPYCNFEEQVSVRDGDNLLMPDMKIKLPGGKSIIVDAKAPIRAYLEAINLTDPDLKEAKLKEHAKQVKERFKQLSSKAYQNQFDDSPDFVIMFIPGESIYSAALMYDPHLIADAVKENVIIASPTILITVLKAISYGWQESRIGENARNISRLGHELYDSIRVLAEHFEKVGVNLGRSLDSYNKAIGSLERNVLSKSRKFTELGIESNTEIPLLDPVEKVSRRIQAEELLTENTDPEK